MATTTVGTLAAFLTANVVEFKKGMQEATGELNRFVKESSKIDRNLAQLGKKFTEFGKTLSAAVTLPIMALGVTAVKAFDEAATAEAKLTSALKMSGQEVGPVLDDFKKFATSIENITTTQDDAVIGMLQMATSMGLTAGAAKDAVTNAIGLAKAFDLDNEMALKAAVAVSAAGNSIAHTGHAGHGAVKEILKLIPTLRSVGDEATVVALATKAMSDGFEVAKSEAEAGLGPWKQALNSFNNLQEEFGAIILEGLQPLIAHVKDLTNWFRELEPETKKTIVVISGIAAAIGPLLLGIGAVISVLPLMGVAFAALTGPIGLTVAALAGVTVALTTVIGDMEEHTDKMNKLNAAYKDGIINREEYTNLVRKGTLAEVDALLASESLTGEVKTGAEAIKYATEIWKKNKATVGGVSLSHQLAAASAKQMGDEEAAAAEKAEVAARKIAAAANEVSLAAQIEAKAIKDSFALMAESLKMPDVKITAVLPISELEKAKIAAREFSLAFSDTPVQVLERQREVLIGFINTAKSGGGAVTAATQKMIDQYQALGAEIETLESQSLGFWGQKLPAAMQKALDVASMVTSAISGVTSQMFSLGSMELANQNAELDNSLAAELARNEASGASEEKKEQNKAEIEESFAKKRLALSIKMAKQEKASAIMSAIVNTASGIMQAFADFPFPVAIGLSAVIGALGAAQIATIASAPMPSLAEGGMAFGETLAVVGDNPNAQSDPEVISPLSKLQDIFQNEKQELRAVIRGEDLILIMDRVKRNRGFIQ